MVKYMTIKVKDINKKDSSQFNFDNPISNSMLRNSQISDSMKFEEGKENESQASNSMISMNKS